MHCAYASPNTGEHQVNKQQFKAIAHEYRELNFKAHANAAYHICTARNCACHDYKERHTGWQWRIAQQHGEGMATRLRRMFDGRKFSLPPVSAKAEKAVREYWGKKERQSILNVARAQIAQKFEGTVEPAFDNDFSDLEALDWATNSAPPVRHGAAGVNPSSSNTNAGAWGAVPFVCSITGDPS